MSFDRVARFVSGVDAILPYQQDRVAPLPVLGSSSLERPPPSSSTRTTPNPSFILPRTSSSASISAALSPAPRHCCVVSEPVDSH